MTTKRNSLLFKIKLENEEADFKVNNFIDLFLENGIFESHLNMVFGIATHNYILKIFNVTFKESNPKSIIEDIYETFKEPQEISSNDNIDFTIQVNRPPGYRQLITLYPMPFDVNAEVLKAITKDWGNLKHFEFGKHKKCSLIHNPYLHLYMENFNRKEIPDSLNFRNRFIAVNIDGEIPKERCNYCKDTSHKLDECPKKISQNNKMKDNKIQNNPFLSKPTYAKTVTSTPKTTPSPFLHPLTKMKLTKQNIKKNTENFPPLNQNPTSPPNEENNNPTTNTTSLTISQEEILKSFDNIQYAKIP